MNAVCNAAPGAGPARTGLLERLRELVGLLEAGDEAAFGPRFDSLIQLREQDLFVNVARLTRDLHEAVRELRFDGRISALAGRDIPEACSRLDYVVKFTEASAHQTLDLVEQCQTLTRDLALAAQEPASADRMRAQVADIASQLRGRLSQLAQAQEYQDIAGQVIKRVTQLIKSVERALLDLLRASGGAGSARPAELPLHGLHGPAIEGITPDAVSQDDADSLLAELGF